MSTEPMTDLLRRVLLSIGAVVCWSDAWAALPDLDAFDRHFREVLAEHAIPGGAYAVVGGGRVLRVEGHGLRAVGGAQAVDADTVFRLASVSKTFAGPLAVQLAQEGRLDLADSLADQLPSLRFKRAELSQRLRVEDLLGQSTGLVPNAYDNLIDDGVALARILPRFRELDAICAPRSCYSYQNIAFAQVEPILARAGGAGYAELVEQRLFHPLGMQRASFGLEALVGEPNHARPHRRAQGRWIEADLKPGYYQLAPAAGVNASARDLAQWLLAQMGAQPEVLAATVIETVTKPRVRTPRELKRRLWGQLLSEAHYGLGWRIYAIDKDALIYHSGWVKGYVAEIAWSPRHQLGLAVLLNAESPAIGRISTSFWAEVHGRAAPSP
jgi:beta-lactamase class C